MADTPLVSVLILSHRPALYLEARASVLAQTFTDYEIVSKESPTYWGEKLNDLARGASGRWLCILCDDDTLTPTYLEKTLAAATLRPDASIIYTDLLVFGRLTVPLRLPEFDAEVLRMYCVPWMTCLIDRRLWNGEAHADYKPLPGTVAGYDPKQRYGDWDFYIRACQGGAVAVHVREPLVGVRDHQQAGSAIMDTAQHDAALRALRQKHSALLQF